uniref:RNase H type-1 domain-containing protein n=1 Tax=Streptomyces avermitilis TaxID=33903 RepID=A0A499V8Q8_STRAX|nr:hypothetical protein SAVMC3_14070 [Streptomyces avermitilis]
MIVLGASPSWRASAASDPGPERPAERGMIGGMSERVVAACDGASKGNPGPAGWAWVVADGEETPTRWAAGALGTATNNVAELTALERLLSAMDPDVRDGWTSGSDPSTR